jgi:hypothetical protein
MEWIGLIWLRIGTSGELLWTRYWTFRFHKMLGGSWGAAQLAAPQEGLSSVSLFKASSSSWMALQPLWALASFSVSWSIHNRQNSLNEWSAHRMASTETLDGKWPIILLRGPVGAWGSLTCSKFTTRVKQPKVPPEGLVPWIFPYLKIRRPGLNPRRSSHEVGTLPLDYGRPLLRSLQSTKYNEMLVVQHLENKCCYMTVLEAQYSCTVYQNSQLHSYFVVLFFLCLSRSLFWLHLIHMFYLTRI